MRRSINLSGPLYIEGCGITRSSGEVRHIESEKFAHIEAWCAFHEINNLTGVRQLHYSNNSQHSIELLELCKRLDPRPDDTFVYVHRGHHSPCKTPLLQLLLANFWPRFRFHALRIEQSSLPLDVILFSIAALGRGRCLIVKDMANRLGPSGLDTTSDIWHLVLSRSACPWAIESITIFEPDPASVATVPPTLLDEFSITDHGRGGGLVSLMSRTSTSRLGIIDIVESR